MVVGGGGTMLRRRSRIIFVSMLGGAGCVVFVTRKKWSNLAAPTTVRYIFDPCISSEVQAHVQKQIGHLVAQRGSARNLCAAAKKCDGAVNKVAVVYTPERCAIVRVHAEKPRVHIGGIYDHVCTACGTCVPSAMFKQCSIKSLPTILVDDPHFQDPAVQHAFSAWLCSLSPEILKECAIAWHHRMDITFNDGLLLMRTRWDKPLDVPAWQKCRRARDYYLNLTKKKKNLWHIDTRYADMLIVEGVIGGNNERTHSA